MNTNYFINNDLKASLEFNNIEITEEILKKLEIYYDFLVEYNKNVNLTAITDKDEVYTKHFADSVLGANLFKKNATVCDIGTGAGFPGVVLKIVRPDLNLVLVDSLNKRVEFLKQLTNKLELDKVTVLHYRAEDIEFKNKYLNSFDYVVARAVAQLNTLTEYCLPFVKEGGSFISYKSDNIKDELKNANAAISILGGNVKKTYSRILNLDTNRCFVVIDKINKTNSKYPRGQNKPKLSPIK